jgi:hypothetical protein
MTEVKLNRYTGIVAIIIIVATILFFVKPIVQSESYHKFADTRLIFGIPNFWNVISNGVFLLIGVYGIWYLLKRTHFKNQLHSLLFFIGISLTGIGSGYYHLHPNSNSLVWDRLPMTLTFMAFFSAVISEFVSEKIGKQLLIPLLFLGVLSVLYWQIRNDLRFYVFIQFTPIIITLFILLTVSNPSSSKKWFWWIIALYIFAKLSEQFDEFIFEKFTLLSGHSIKHILAGCSGVVYLNYLKTSLMCSPYVS